MAFADATSAGQEVCAIPTVAERETADTTLNTVASTFLISVILSQFVSHFTRAAFAAVFSRFASGPHGARTHALRCSLDAKGCLSINGKQVG
jgi:hypothetical protein